MLCLTSERPCLNLTLWYFKCMVILTFKTFFYGWMLKITRLFLDWSSAYCGRPSTNLKHTSSLRTNYSLNLWSPTKQYGIQNISLSRELIEMLEKIDLNTLECTQEDIYITSVVFLASEALLYLTSRSLNHIEIDDKIEL